MPSCFVIYYAYHSNSKSHATCIDRIEVKKVVAKTEPNKVIEYAVKLFLRNCKLVMQDLEIESIDYIISKLHQYVCDKEHYDLMRQGNYFDIGQDVTFTESEVIKNFFHMKQDLILCKLLDQQVNLEYNIIPDRLSLTITNAKYDKPSTGCSIS